MSASGRAVVGIDIDGGGHIDSGRLLAHAGEVEAGDFAASQKRQLQF